MSRHFIRPPNHQASCLNGAVLLLASLFACMTPAAHALDAIVLEVRELTIAGIPAKNVSVRLDVLSDKQTRAVVRAHSAELPAPAGRFTDLLFECAEPVIAEPSFGCARGRFSARGGPTGSIDMNMAVELRSDTGVTTVNGSGLKIAGTVASFEARTDERGWKVGGRTGAAPIAELLKFAEPWFKLPADITMDGNAIIDGSAADSGSGTSADVTLKLEDLNLTNEASTIVTENLTAAARLRAQLGAESTALELEMEGAKGQALLGPILLDLGVNPLNLETRGVLRGQQLAIDTLRFRQKSLIDVNGAGTVNLAAETPSLSGNFQLAKLEFPAAYTSYMQITLAASLLGDLAMRGTLSGELSIVDNGVTSLHLKPEGLDLRDRQGRLHIESIAGDVHWAPAGVGVAQLSRLAWKSGGAYGLSGGAADLEFVVFGQNFALARPTKLPVFDGGLAIENFAMANLGGDNLEVSFAGGIEPISMPLLAKAFGWPEFSGTLAASIPGVRLRDNVLTFDGNVESNVFGGTIVGSNIRIKDPLGNLPEFFADVRARDLDLDLVTRTFEVGSITGKLEADVLGLELFAWTPTRFDARLATPEGDRSRRRISAKAVSSLSNVGGGGGGVMQALQSGVLRFFDEYRYEKLGITCRLRGDICEMSGVEPAPGGYFIVKGAGIPRIDIIGNVGRVRWSQLMSSIQTANFEAATVQ